MISGIPIDVFSASKDKIFLVCKAWGNTSGSFKAKQLATEFFKDEKKISGREIYIINHWLAQIDLLENEHGDFKKTEEGIQFFRICQDDTEQSINFLRNYLFSKVPLYVELKKMFSEKKEILFDDLADFIRKRNIQPRPVSNSRAHILDSYYVPARWLIDLLVKFGHVIYIEQEKRIIWKNGVSDFVKESELKIQEKVEKNVTPTYYHFLKNAGFEDDEIFSIFKQIRDKPDEEQKTILKISVKRI